MRLTFGFAMSVVASAAFAEAPGVGTYFCRAEFAGGLAFSDKTKDWHGAVFSPPHTNFVLRLEDPGTTASGKRSADARRVTITPEGASDLSECLDVSKELMEMDRVELNDSILRCMAMGGVQYQINIANNRFMKIYPFGYINGEDINSDTPAITGGRCTKLK